MICIHTCEEPMDLETLYDKETSAILENHALQREALENLRGEILRAGSAIRNSLGAGGKVMLFGNGGSAADAQHWAAELSGRYLRERPGLAAVALTTDTSAITAIANDYGYDRIFERQVEALARPGDVAVGISTSGNSPNVLKGLQEAQCRGCTTIALLGRDGGEIAKAAGISLVYPAAATPRIQEFHAVLVHIICALVDADPEG
jgi:D-sedoheptulose 7-phosphate isomerase